MRLRVFEHGADHEAPRSVTGVAQLRAEARWLVEGSPAQVEAVARSVGAVATRVTETLLELRFGNAVGWFDGGPLGHLEVRTGKWGEGEYQALLARVTEVAAGLPFAAGAASALPYERSVLDPDGVAYQAFAHLRRLIGTPVRPSTRLVGPVTSVLARPHRKTIRARRVVPTALAGRVDPPVLVDIVSGRWPLQPARGPGLARALGGRLPERVEESVLSLAVDTPENRFVKHLLAFCAGLVAEVRAAGADRPRLIAECDHLDAVLRPLSRHRMWADVGRMNHFPASSTVLQGRADYRALFAIYNELRLSTRLLVAPNQMLDFLEAKDIALLYEMWACVAVLRAVEAALGPPARLSAPARSVFDLKLRWGIHAAWADGTEVVYNGSWSRGGAPNRRSYSVPLRPDIVLTVPAGAAKGRHVFDAKFKLTSVDALVPAVDEGAQVDEDERGGTYKRVDLYKMHTYRDALSAVRSAWVLYPGREVCFFPVVGVPVAEVAALGAEVDGVGAVPLVPDGSNGALQAVVDRLLGRGTTGTSARSELGPGVFAGG